jgi:hypothetical protein
MSLWAKVQRFRALKTKWKVLFSVQAAFTLGLVRYRFALVSERERADAELLGRFRGERRGEMNPLEVSFGGEPEERWTEEELRDLIVIRGEVVKGNPGKRPFWKPLLEFVGLG